MIDDDCDEDVGADDDDDDGEAEAEEEHPPKAHTLIDRNAVGMLIFSKLVQP